MQKSKGDADAAKEDAPSTQVPEEAADGSDRELFL